MSKRKKHYICQNCKAVATQWSGRCASCNEWNTIVEVDAGETVGGALGGPKAKSKEQGRAVPLVGLDDEIIKTPRMITGIAEFDRVTGGGLVAGSALLVGGDPGIGKSTLLLQTAAHLARKGKKVIYISGEEAVAQVQLRAQRLGVDKAPLLLACETCTEDILATLAEIENPDLIIIDSIQTLWTMQTDSAPGSVTQVRTSVQSLVRYAKNSGAAVILVGHVTKDGQIAGPRVVEHMVDAVLYFEGDRTHHFRILRGVKNRFGPTDEIGVFEMAGQGLRQVLNPSELFLSERSTETPGVAVFAGLEGTRPLLVEVQALVSPSNLGTPRRTALGWDTSRLSMILAVLETRCGLKFGDHDVYLAVAGGLKLTEAAADLAVAAALISSLSSKSLPIDAVFFGEISLSSSIRAVPQAELRMKEAERLGFKQAFTPALKEKNKTKFELKILSTDHLDVFVSKIVH